MQGLNLLKTLDFHTIADARSILKKYKSRKNKDWLAEQIIIELEEKIKDYEKHLDQDMEGALNG